MATGIEMIPLRLIEAIGPVSSTPLTTPVAGLIVAIAVAGTRGTEDPCRRPPPMTVTIGALV